jgi:acyl carrier protein
MNVDELKSTIASALNIPVDKVTDDSSGQTLSQWDSIGHMSLIVALEQRFNTSFTIDEIMAMRDVATIRKVLEGKLSASTTE